MVVFATNLAIEFGFTLVLGDNLRDSISLPGRYPNFRELLGLGRFLYASNRGHDSIAIFTIDAEQGRLTPAGNVSTQGRTPRAFAIDPTGTHLIAANQNSQNLVVLQINPDTGALIQTSSLEVFEPVSIVFVSVP